MARKAKSLAQKRISEMYRKERKRITQTIRRYRQKGYDVDVTLPSLKRGASPQPEDVQRLRRITLSRIKENTYAVSEPERYQRTNLFGEVKLYAPKGSVGGESYSNASLDGFLRELEAYPETAKRAVESWLQSIINKQGAQAASEAVDYGYTNGLILTASEVYSDQKYGYYKLTSNLAQMLKYLDLSAGEVNDILNDVDVVGEDVGLYYGDLE